MMVLKMPSHLQSFVGFLMLCANTIVPGAALTIGILTQGLSFPDDIAELRKRDDDDDDDVDNPLDIND